MNSPLQFDRIARPRRLPDEVAATISKAIDSKQLKPGDKLPSENELSERFGVARTVIREAISLLKYDGVVDSRRGIGAFIAKTENRSAFRISPACFEIRKQIVQLLQLRTGVQAGASALAAQMRTADQLEAIENAHQLMVEADKQGAEQALEKRVDSELLFYRLITQASANSYYEDVVGMIESNIQSNLRSAFLKNAAASEFGPDILAEHFAVLQGIQTQDVEAARRATRHRFEQAAQRLVAREDFA